MADRCAESWYPTAAYLYILHLDGSALAWEYLHRHPDYRRDWLRRRRRSDAAQRSAGGCACWKTRPWMRATRIRRGFPATMPCFSSTRIPTHRPMPWLSRCGAFLATST